MNSRQKIFINIFLVSTILFIGFSFIFFIWSKLFFGAVVIFCGILNLISYQTAPRRVSMLNIYMNIFNGLLSYFVADNYAIANYSTLYILWSVIMVSFFVVVILQIHTRILSIRKRKKMKKRFD